MRSTLTATHRPSALDHTLVVPPGAEHGFRATAEGAKLLVFFPVLDPYEEGHTHYLEGSRPTAA